MKLPCRGVLGNQDQVPAARDPAVQANPLSQHTLDPVSNDRVPYLLGDREPEPTFEVWCGPLPENRKDMTTVRFSTVRLHGDVVGALSQPHLLGYPQGSAAGHVLLLGGRHREALAALGAAATQNLTATTGLLAGAEAVGPLAALVMRLVRTLHGSLRVRGF